MYQPLSFSAWPSMNVVQDHGRVRKRCGYKADLTTVSEVDVQGVYVYQRRDGSRETVILSEEDVMVRKTGTDETFKYFTPRTAYTGTAQVDEIDAATKLVVTFEGAATLEADGIEAGDYFILDEDWADANKEPDASWRKIASVDSETQLTLEAAYEKAVTANGGKDATIRTVYTGMPTGGRWVVAVCDDTFCFSHGGVNVQKIAPAGTVATDLDTTYAVKARYMLTYANRLFLADLYIKPNGDAVREPWSIQWSKEGDVTDWTDSTAGTADFLDSQDVITGLGRVGNKIIIYKKDSFHVGHRTGVATAAIAVPTHRRGAGLWAPYSLIHVEGTNAYQGREDFYIIEGDVPKSIGAPIRDRFFDEVPEGALVDTWGCWDGGRNRCLWFSGTKSLGQVAWIWDYKEDAWTTFKFYHEITGAGMGGVG